MFFTLVFDLHNLQKQGNLRSMAHPKSPLRWELLSDLKDWESTLLVKDNKRSTLDDLEKGMINLSVKDPADNLECAECGAKYKKPWTLKAHIIKKHGLANKCEVCDALFQDVEEYKSHMASHNINCNICDKVFSSDSRDT